MSAADAMAAEFDTVAEWTAEAARALGPDHYVPAGCRGSGGPAALDWFVDRLGLDATDTLLDVGAGVGGPAGYARERTGIRSLLAEPEAGAGRAARSLFGLPVVRADAAALPVGDASFAVAWCLGVLCTTPDHGAVLSELRRVVRVGGRVGLLVYAAATELALQPAGNNFPDRSALPALVRDAGFEIVDEIGLADLADAPPDWARRADAVENEIERRHGADEAWRTAEVQQRTMGRLIASGQVTGELFALRVCPA